MSITFYYLLADFFLASLDYQSFFIMSNKSNFHLFVLKHSWLNSYLTIIYCPSFANRMFRYYFCYIYIFSYHVI